MDSVDSCFCFLVSVDRRGLDGEVERGDKLFGLTFSEICKKKGLFHFILFTKNIIEAYSLFTIDYIE